MPSTLTSMSVGDWLSVAGLLLSIAGFYLTWREARKSRTAAEAAKLAAEGARRSRRLVDVSLELRAIADRLTELKYLVQTEDWSGVPARIDALCFALSTTSTAMAEGNAVDFGPDDTDFVSGLRAALREIEKKLTARGAKQPQTAQSISAFHRQIVQPLTAMMDQVTSIHTRARNISSRN